MELLKKSMTKIILWTQSLRCLLLIVYLTAVCAVAREFRLLNAEYQYTNRSVLIELNPPVSDFHNFISNSTVQNPTIRPPNVRSNLRYPGCLYTRLNNDSTPVPENSGPFLVTTKENFLSYLLPNGRLNKSGLEKSSSSIFLSNRNNGTPHKKGYQVGKRFRYKRSFQARRETIKEPTPALENIAARLLSKRNSTSLKESKIAAIFRGVAYGIPTENPDKVISKIKLPFGIIKQPIFRIDSSRVLHNNKNKSHSVANENSIKEGISDKIPFVKFDKAAKTEDIGDLPIKQSERVEENSIGDLNSAPTSANTNKKQARKEDAFSPNMSGGSDVKVNNQDANKSNFAQGEIFINGNSSAVQTNAWIQARKILGTSWRIHVHMATCIYTAITIVAIYLLCRGKVWHDIPPCLFVLFYASIISATSFRSVGYFLEACSSDSTLTFPVNFVLWNLSIPLIMSVLAIFLLVLLKTSSYRLMSLPPSFVLLICFIHCILYFCLELLFHAFKIKSIKKETQIGIDIFSTVWGLVLSIHHIILLVKIEKHNKSDIKFTTDNQLYAPPRLRKALRLSTVSVFCVIVFCAVIVFTIASEKESVPSTPLFQTVWFWFFTQTVNRSLEIIFWIFILLSSSALVHYKQGDCPPTQGSNLCTLFSKCWITKTSNVHPMSKRTQPSAIFTLQKPQRSSFDYATNDFQLVWNNGRRNEGPFDTNNDLAIKDVTASIRRPIRNLTPMKFLPSNCRGSDSYFTPSPDEYYHSPLSKSTTGLYDNIQIEHLNNKQTPGFKPYFPCKGFYVDNYKYLGNTLPNRLSDQDREEEPENLEIRDPSSTSSYWTPQDVQSSRQTHITKNVASERPANEVREMAFHSLDFLSSFKSRDDAFNDEPNDASNPGRNFAGASSTLSRRSGKSAAGIIKNSSCGFAVGSSSSSWQPVHTLPVRLSSSSPRENWPLDNDEHNICKIKE